ncbi:MAG: hypothetical protein QME41_05785 [Actinomycetota bacterium]|nr:hypothetical protein [Actinomycetota bacterium]
MLIALLIVGCGYSPWSRGQYQRSVALPYEFDDLIQELRKSKYEIIMDNNSSLPIFSVQGQVVLLDDERIEVYAYKNERIANQAATTISADGFSITFITDTGVHGAREIDWVAAPHFYKKGSLIVLYVGDKQDITTLLVKILGTQFAGR